MLLNSQHLKYKGTKGGLGVGGEHALQYNTDPDLFRMQLQDSGFRAHFLLEVLIFLHRLQCPGKNSSATSELSTPELLNEVQLTREQVMSFLSEEVVYLLEAHPELSLNSSEFLLSHTFLAVKSTVKYGNFCIYLEHRSATMI